MACSYARTSYVKTYVQDIRRIRFVQTARRSGRLQIALWHVVVESPSTGGFEVAQAPHAHPDRVGRAAAARRGRDGRPTGAHGRRRTIAPHTRVTGEGG